jgi:hypothetical protein
MLPGKLQPASSLVRPQPASLFDKAWTDEERRGNAERAQDWICHPHVGAQPVVENDRYLASPAWRARYA